MTETNAFEYLQTRVQDEGIFHARAFAWTLIESKSSSAQGVRVQYQILNKWHDEGAFKDSPMWAEPWPIGHFAEGTLWIIGKDGNLSEAQIKRFVDIGLWTDPFEALAGPPPQVDLCITIKGQENNGRTYYEVDWVNAYEEKPKRRGGGTAVTPADPSALSALRARFRGQMAAITGAPAAKKVDPTAPAAPAAPVGTAPAPATEVSSEDADAEAEATGHGAPMRPAAPSAPAGPISEEETPF